MSWRDAAACLGTDPELFFPIGHGDTEPARVQVEEAKAVCRRCDVRENCLEWALETGQDHGVWGGLTEHERRRWVRDRTPGRFLRDTSSTPRHIQQLIDRHIPARDWPRHLNTTQMALAKRLYRLGLPGLATSVEQGRERT